MAARAYQIWHGDYPVIASRENGDQKMPICDCISVYYNSMTTKVWYFRLCPGTAQGRGRFGQARAWPGSRQVRALFDRAGRGIQGPLGPNRNPRRGAGIPLGPLGY